MHFVLSTARREFPPIPWRGPETVVSDAQFFAKDFLEFMFARQLVPVGVEIILPPPRDALPVTRVKHHQSASGC